jgi:hypothetical protein
MEYVIYASLHEESNNGWIWLSRPQLGSRSLIRVKNLDNGMKVFCQLREIDDDFVALYNERPRTIPLQNSNREKAAVISDWYRRGLGIPGTKASVNLEVTPAYIPGWHAIRACCHHPDPVVRLATRLGAWSLVLGSVGLALGIHFSIPWRCVRAFSEGAFVILSLVLLCAIRGIRRPSS